MDYRDFTFDRLTKGFGVAICGERDMFANAPPVEASPWLVESLKRAGNAGFGNAKSRSERFVSPVLMELSTRNKDIFALISGASLDLDPDHNLHGECDFILSATRLRDFVRAPVFCIIEATEPDLDVGVVRCAAQLLGAARFNKRENKVTPTLYGCCTSGVEWRFLRFSANTFVRDEARYLINEPAKLLGVLQHIVDEQLVAKAAGLG